MKSSEKQEKKAITQTGQLPRAMLEGMQQVNAQSAESEEQQDTGSITGVFHLGKRADGVDSTKERHDSPKAGSAPVEPAKQ